MQERAHACSTAHTTQGRAACAHARARSVARAQGRSQSHARRPRPGALQPQWQKHPPLGAAASEGVKRPVACSTPARKASSRWGYPRRGTSEDANPPEVCLNEDDTCPTLWAPNAVGMMRGAPRGADLTQASGRARSSYPVPSRAPDRTRTRRIALVEASNATHAVSQPAKTSSRL